MYHILDEVVVSAKEKPTYLMRVSEHRLIFSRCRAQRWFFELYIRAGTDVTVTFIQIMEKMNLFNQKYQLDPLDRGRHRVGMPPLQQSLYPSSAESKEMLGMRLCVLHNLYFYNNMMTKSETHSMRAILPLLQACRSLPVGECDKK